MQLNTDLLSVSLSVDTVKYIICSVLVWCTKPVKPYWSVLLHVNGIMIEQLGQWMIIGWLSEEGNSKLLELVHNMVLRYLLCGLI